MSKETKSIQRENLALTRPLQDCLTEIDTLVDRLVHHKARRLHLIEIQSRIDDESERSEQLQWLTEVHEQRLQVTHAQIADLVDRLRAEFMHVLERQGLREMLSERQITAMRQDLEKTDATLGELTNAARSNVMAASTSAFHAQPQPITLQDVLLSKNRQLQVLEDSIASVRQKRLEMQLSVMQLLRDNNLAEHEVAFPP